MRKTNPEKRLADIVPAAAAALLLLLIPLSAACRSEKNSKDLPASAVSAGPNEIPEVKDLYTFLTSDTEDAETLLADFCKANGISRDEYPGDLVELLKRNPDTREFVLMYPFRKNDRPPIDLSAYAKSDDVPLLLQWDARWGYTQYNDAPMGLSGCGPTCLSMALIHLTKDASYTPLFVADYAEKHGYAVKGVGTAWKLISEGGKKLGLNVEELPLDKGRMERALSDGAVIILNVGKGDFTENGHFLVIKGEKDGAFEVNDPNSPTRSLRLWTYEELAGQIRILWACQKK